MKRPILYALIFAALTLAFLSGCSRKTQQDNNPLSTAAPASLPQLKTILTQPAQVSPTNAPAAAQSSQPQAAATAAPQSTQNAADLNNLADDIDKSLNGLQKDIDSTDNLNDVP